MSSFVMVAVIIVVALGAVGYIAYRLLSNSDGAVPVTGYDEIQRAKMEYLAQQKKQPSYSSGQAVPVGEVNYHETAILKDKIMTLEDENAQLRSQVSTLERSKGELTQTKERLTEAQTKAEALREDNDALNKKIAEQAQKFKELNDEVERITEELDSTRGQESLGQEIWEKEIAELKAEKEQLMAARYELEELKKKNLVYEDVEVKVNSKYRRLLERFVALRRRVKEEEKEKNAAIDKLKSESRILESKMALMEQERENLVKELDLLRNRSQKTSRLENLGEILDQKKAVVKKEEGYILDDADRQRDELAVQHDLMQRNYEKVKELNEHLLEKEKILQYELTKSRAHSLGLEKVCEGLAEKIESYNL